VRIGGAAARPTARARPEGIAELANEAERPAARTTATAAVPAPACDQPVTGRGELDYRWFGSDADGKPGILKQLAQSTIDTLRRAVADVRSLEVITYVGDVQDARSAAAGDAIGHAHPKAYTCCKIDGDTILSVPLDEHGAVEAELWRIHEAAVAQARQQRADTLRLILSLLPGVGP
jgi:hypothetical protein